MKWLVRSFFAISVLAAAALIGGLFLPSRARVERSVSIDRPPATVYTLLSSLRTYHDWSPWAREEPGAVFGFEGPDFGVGATYLWAGEAIGAGEMMIVRAEPYDVIEAAVDLGPQGGAHMTFDIEPKPGGSTVTWSYDTEFGLNLIGRYAGRFFDRQLGQDFTQGLVNLKAHAERLPGADFAGIEAAVVTVAPAPAVVYAGQVRGGSAEQEAAFERALTAVRLAMREAELREAGPAIAVTNRWEPPLWVFEAAVPYGGEPNDGIGDAVSFGETPGGRAVRAIHRGAPSGVAPLGTKLEAYVAAHRLTAREPTWEVRVTERDETPAEEQVTEIYIPVE